MSLIQNQTTIRDPHDMHKKKKFRYDYSYWSHDGFFTDENGVAKPENEKYVSQEKRRI